jgi:hypothetical protein
MSAASVGDAARHLGGLMAPKTVGRRDQNFGVIMLHVTRYVR